MSSPHGYLTSSRDDRYPSPVSGGHRGVNVNADDKDSNYSDDSDAAGVEPMHERRPLHRMLFGSAASYTVDARILALPADCTLREDVMCCYQPQWLKAVSSFANVAVEAEYSVFKTHGAVLAETLFILFVGGGAAAIVAAPLPPSRKTIMYYILGALEVACCGYVVALVVFNWQRNTHLEKIRRYGEIDRARNALTTLTRLRAKAALAWPFITLCLGMLVSIGGSYCPRPPAPESTTTADACRNSCPISIALAVSLTTYFAPRPFVAVMSLTLVIVTMCAVQAAVISEYEPSETLGRIGVLFGLALSLTIVSLGREGMLREHFSSLVASQRLKTGIVKQITVLGSVVEQVLPRRVARRVASLKLDPDADAPMLWDVCKNATVAVIQPVDFGLFARRRLDVDVTAMLHHLFTLFDSATALFGIDKATAFGDTYVVTAGLLGRHNKPVDLVRFAWWARCLDDTAIIPLRAVICMGLLEGGVPASTAAPRYLIGGSALQLALSTAVTISAPDVVLCKATVAAVSEANAFTVEWLSPTDRRFARVREVSLQHPPDEVGIELPEAVELLPEVAPSASAVPISPSAVGTVAIATSVQTIPHAVAVLSPHQSTTGASLGSDSGGVAVENLARLALKSRWTREATLQQRYDRDGNPLGPNSPVGKLTDHSSNWSDEDDLHYFWGIAYGTFKQPEAEALFRESVRAAAQASQWRPLLAVLIVTIIYAIFAFVISPPTDGSLLNIITYGGAGAIVVTHIPVIILNFVRPNYPPFFVTALLFALVLTVTVAYIWVAPSSTMRNDPLFTIISTVALLKHFVLAPLPAWATAVLLNVFYVIPLAALYEFNAPGVVLIIVLPLLSTAYIYEVAFRVRQSFAATEQVKDSLHAAQDAAERLRALVANIVPPHVAERGLDWIRETSKSPGFASLTPDFRRRRGVGLSAAIEAKLQTMMSIVRGRHNVVVTDVFAGFIMLRVRVVPRTSEAAAMNLARVSGIVEFAVTEAGSSVFRNASVIPLRTIGSLGLTFDLGGPFPNAAEPYVPKWLKEQTGVDDESSPRPLDMDESLMNSFTSATGYNARNTSGGGGGGAEREFTPMVERPAPPAPRVPLRERARMVVMPSDDDVRGAAVGALAVVRLISLALVPLGFDVYAAAAEEEAAAALLGERTLRYGVSGAIVRRINGLSAVLDLIEASPRSRRVAQPCFVATSHFHQVVRDALQRASKITEEESGRTGVVFPVDIPTFTPLSKLPVRVPDLGTGDPPVVILWNDDCDVM